MKTFEELLAENTELSGRLQTITAELKASADRHTELNGQVAKIKASLDAMEGENTKAAAVAEKSAEVLTKAIGDATARIAALEEAKVELDRKVTTELAKRGIATTAASDRAGKATGEDVIAQYEAEKDPIAAGRFFAKHRDSILAGMRGR